MNLAGVATDEYSLFRTFTNGSTTVSQGYAVFLVLSIAAALAAVAGVAYFALLGNIGAGRRRRAFHGSDYCKFPVIT